MDISIILIASIVGTTFMTLFSYIISKIFNKLYKEPVLLHYLLRFMKTDISEQMIRIFGRIIHYMIGLAFVIIYDILWRNHIQIFWMSALIFGTLSGILGILS